MKRTATWTSIAAMALSASVMADEPAAADDPADAGTTTETLYDDLPPTTYLGNWRLDDPDLAEVGAFSTNRTTAFDDVAFRDSTAIERLGRYRSLSLLTFAEVGTARLFLGVNEDGLFGLHLNSTPKPDEETTVEVVRMPYLGTRDAGD